MRLRFPDLTRIRLVRDVCPLPGFPSHDATVWKGVTAKSPGAPVMEHENGYTVTDFRNRFITWHRTFTQDYEVPELTAKSFIHVHEWIPPTHSSTPSSYAESFKRFGMDHHEAIAVVELGFETRWSTQAKRHLANTRKNKNLAVRFGTMDEAKKIVPKSQVPKNLHDTFLALSERHIKAHPADVEILIATLNDAPVAAFVAAHCHAGSESSYLMGCFVPEGGKAHAMVALVKFWFDRCLTLSIRHANFGDIVGPHPFPFNSFIGYSIFKTHFNIHRVWMPGSRWRIRLHFSLLRVIQRTKNEW